MFSIVEILLNEAVSKGVQIHYNKPVSRIATNKNRADSIILEDGSEIKADVIVANADLPYVYRKLLPGRAKSWKLDRMKYSASAICIHLGLDKQYPQLCHHSVFLSDGFKKGLDKIFKEKSVSATPSFYMHAPAKSCYRFMRAIDDMIDNHKSKNKLIAPEERKEFTSSVNDWLKMIIVSEECNPLQLELVETVNKFRIPLWPLEDFARSMIFDINNDGFPTLDAFLEYSKGASVAPAAIFVHLNGLRSIEGRYEDPPFDVSRAATPVQYSVTWFILSATSGRTR